MSINEVIVLKCTYSFVNFLQKDFELKDNKLHALVYYVLKVVCKFKTWGLLTEQLIKSYDAYQNRDKIQFSTLKNLKQQYGNIKKNLLQNCLFEHNLIQLN